MPYLDSSGVTALTGVYDDRYASKTDVSSIGAISTSTAMSSDVAIASATWMNYSQNSKIPKITLTKGVYILEVKVTFGTATDGARIVAIDSDQSHTDLDIRIAPSPSGATRIHYCKIVAPTATTTYYMNVYQNSGSSINLNADSCLKAVRII